MSFNSAVHGLVSAIGGRPLAVALMLCSVLYLVPVVPAHAQTSLPAAYEPASPGAIVAQTIYSSVFASYRFEPRERLWPWTQLFTPDGSHADRSMLEASAVEVTVQRPAGGHESHGGGRPVTVVTSPTSAADPHAAHQRAPAASAAVASVDVPVPEGSDLVGVVQSIERGSSQVELKHGPIAKLGMGGMTMWFRLKDAALADQVEVGARFACSIEITDRGIVITRVQRMPEK